MVSLPYDIFRRILSFRDLTYEYAIRTGTPSSQWAKEYTILQPCAEYQMINGRIVSLYWGRPYMSVHGWNVGMALPTRAGF